jgi:hypothetical protein
MNRLMVRASVLAMAAAIAPLPALAQADDVATLRRELNAARAQIEAQDARLRALEARLAASPAGNSAQAQVSVPMPNDGAMPVETAAIEQVGEAPLNFDRAPEVAVLGDQGSVITRPGQLTIEPQLEYARADRNRALFRGIEVVESVLVGVFDINESRQDVLTASLMARYGITSRFEVGVRLPFIRRSDTSILAPVAGSTNDDGAATIDSSARGSGLGDVELTLRYQLTDARASRPFLIANLQVAAPTGTSPFSVPRDTSGRALEAATGAGFWSVSPSLTAILPTDPAVMFGSLGYTHNFGRDVDTIIPPVRITNVQPGDAISASAGIGISLNQRTSFNLGYAHSWTFGTETTTALLEPTPTDSGERSRTSRDLQIGRFLFGVTYRVSDRASINWAVEVGATDDATDLRTVLRVPFIALTGG